MSSPSRLRVAMVGLRAPAEGLGGIEEAVRNLAPRLAARGVDLTVFGRRRWRSHATSIRGVRQRYLPSLPQPGIETLTSVAATVPLLRGFDLVHFHALGPGLFAPAARGWGAATVLTVHGLDWRRDRWGPSARGMLWLGEWVGVRSAHRIISVSPSLMTRLSNTAPGRVHCIGNGVPELAAPVRPPWPLPERFQLFLARLVPEKGLETLLLARRRLDQPLPLVIAGPTPRGAERWVAELRRRFPEPDLLWVGPVVGGAKSWLLHHADAFLLPSTLEGHPLTLLEAASCCLPLVVSSLAELDAVIGRGEELALRHPPRDVDSLAHALTRLADDPAEARDRALRASELLMARYDWERITDQTLAVYREALGAAGVPS